MTDHADSLREQITEAIDSWWAEAEFRTAFYDGVEHIASIPLADAVLALLGEVTVTEEWSCVVDDCDTCGPRRRRTVVTTRRVGEWEVAE